MRRRHKKRPLRLRLRLPDLGPQICADKSARGNVFPHLIPALEAAEEQTRLQGLRFMPRRCECCGRWHLTADRRHKEEC